MAYKFGQFRKEQYAYSNYVKQIDRSDYQLVTVISNPEGFSGIEFQDVAIKKPFSTADGSLFFKNCGN